MEEPNVSTYVRPMKVSERDENGIFNLKDEGVIIAFKPAYIKIYNLQTGIDEVSQNTPIPLRAGRMEAFATDVSQSENPSRKKMNLTDCRNILTRQEIENSPSSFQKGVDSNSTVCLDPSDALISKYIDDLGSSTPFVVEFRFQHCKLYSDSKESCAEKFHVKEMNIEFYVMNTAIDFSAKELYALRWMKKLDGISVFKGALGTARLTELRRFETSFYDSVFSLF